jgi:drug/metabolite transporter (DMT)-like permease
MENVYGHFMAKPGFDQHHQKSAPAMTTSKAQALTLLAAFLWGTSFVVIEFGLELINPFWFAQLRFLIASLGALVVVLILKKRIDRKLLFGHWVWLMGLFNALGFLGQFVGQTMTNATKTALLVNLNLITVALLSTLFLNERFNKLKGFAIVLSLTGVFLLTTNGNLAQLTTGEFIGDMFALCAGFSWALYIVSNKTIITKMDIDIVPLTACVMITTTTIMLPFTLIFGGFSPGNFSIDYHGIGYIIYLGVFCNVIPFTLWTYGLKHLSATNSTILLLVEVLVAAILGFLLLQEYLTLIGALGGGFIIIAIFIINYNFKK